MAVVKQDDESTGLCPVGGCDKIAYPYSEQGAPALGYVDACEDHAEVCYADMRASALPLG